MIKTHRDTFLIELTDSSLLQFLKNKDWILNLSRLDSISKLLLLICVFLISVYHYRHLQSVNQKRLNIIQLVFTFPFRLNMVA